MPRSGFKRNRKCLGARNLDKHLDAGAETTFDNETCHARPQHAGTGESEPIASCATCPSVDAAA
jgi:hypothetical protein